MNNNIRRNMIDVNTAKNAPNGAAAGQNFYTINQGASLNYDTSSLYPAAIKVDDNHVLGTYETAGGNMEMVIWAIDKGTRVITEPVAATNMTTGAGGVGNTLVDMGNGTHFLNVYRGASGDGYCRIIAVNTSTWVSSTPGSEYEFRDLITMNGADACFISTTKVLVVYNTAGTTSYAKVLDINTGTWNITDAGSEFTITSMPNANLQLDQLDANHFIVSSGGKSVVLEVNLSTFAVTEPDSLHTWDASGADEMTQELIDSTHVSIVFEDSAVAKQVSLSIDGSWAITTEVASSTMAVESFQFPQVEKNSDDAYSMLAYRGGSGGDGYIQVTQNSTTDFRSKPSTFPLEFDTSAGPDNYPAVANFDDGWFLVAYKQDGVAQAYAIAFEIT